MVIGFMSNSSESNDLNLFFQKVNESVSNNSHLLITGDFNLAA